MLASAGAVDAGQIANHVEFLKIRIDSGNTATFDWLAREALDLLQGNWRNMNLGHEVTKDEDGQERKFTAKDATHAHPVVAPHRQHTRPPKHGRRTGPVARARSPSSGAPGDEPARLSSPLAAVNRRSPTTKPLVPLPGRRAAIQFVAKLVYASVLV